MFDSLSDRLSRTLRSVAGRGRLTEDNIRESVREVRLALLDADVALAVVRQFTADVQERAVGREVTAALDPGQAFVKIVNDELVRLMGEANESLALSATPPAVVLMAGLQGAGKTSTVAKLARFLKEVERKRVAVVSADVYRPAAIEQLRTLSGEVEARFIPSASSEQPTAIAKRALADAKRQFDDVLLVDTAGRLAIDDAMMAEIAALHAVLDPVETLFVVDAMSGQDAATTAKAFNDALPLTGVVLAKADGDARGGAALSVRAVTGKPIKFLAVGEQTDALEAFHPERIASRILGMGDMLTLIEEAERKVDKRKAMRLARKVQRGSKFDLVDLQDQIRQMFSMGGVENLLDKIPGAAQMPAAVRDKLDEREYRRMDAIINSMTLQERHFPDVINPSRKRRIAAGSGTGVPDVNRLLKQHKQMQKTVKKVSRKGGIERMMRGIGGAAAGGGRPRRVAAGRRRRR